MKCGAPSFVLKLAVTIRVVAQAQGIECVHEDMVGCAGGDLKNLEVILVGCIFETRFDFVIKDFPLVEVMGLLPVVEKAFYGVSKDGTGDGIANRDVKRSLIGRRLGR